MKDVIILKKAQEKNGLLVMKNIDKIAQVKIAIISSPIDLDGKYM